MQDVAREGIAGWPPVPEASPMKRLMASVLLHRRVLGRLSARAAAPPDPNLYSFHERPGGAVAGAARVLGLGRSRVCTWAISPKGCR